MFMLTKNKRKLCPCALKEHVLLTSAMLLIILIALHIAVSYGVYMHLILSLR